MTNLLQILIPTVAGRDYEFDMLMRKIWAQTKFIDNGIVYVDSYIDRKEMTIGEKRELLYQRSVCKYSWQIDDDDDISINSIGLILQAIKDGNVDCITFQEKCLMNGNRYTCNHSIIYDDWRDNFDGYDFVRTPFYKDVIKTEIAKSIPFEHIRYGEDHAWSRAIKPHLKSEIHISEELYIYQHNSKPEDFNSRYGYDKP